VGGAVAELWAFVFPQRPLKGILLALLLCPEISNILDHLPPEQGSSAALVQAQGSFGPG
jgi:hypothetical protein